VEQNTTIQPKYDSELDTLKHSRRVDELLLQIVGEIQTRVTQHDLSKMREPEKATFDEYSQKLKTSTYGSDEYKSFLDGMKPCLDHHYKANRHHPEHFSNGINGMNLIDLVEMLADWKAAGERHADGSMARSLEIQQSRFDITNQLLNILSNTAAYLGWFGREEET
jgi:Family of unknown function (DUF5662)